MNQSGVILVYTGMMDLAPRWRYTQNLDMKGKFMSDICPVCNGLYDKFIICDNCGMPMEQAGRPEDYSEPYGPYMEKDTLMLDNDISASENNRCMHLYTCPNCHRLKHSAVQIMSI